MKRKREMPFKKQQKYVVERKIEGEKTLFWNKDGETKFKPSNSIDKRVASVINDKDFVLEGYVADECFYACDVIYYDDEDIRDEDWPTRYKILKNEFRFNSAVKMNRPLVVTGREEMEEAIDLFTMLDFSEGVLVREYDSSYTGSEKVFLPEEAV